VGELSPPLSFLFHWDYFKGKGTLALKETFEINKILFHIFIYSTCIYSTTNRFEDPLT
jgi:hypothetical protein